MSPLRLDRFAALRVAYPFLRRLAADEKASVPILMYHSVSESFEKMAHPYYALHTSPRRFAAQMKYLADNRYAVISLEQAIRAGKNRPERNVVITFDDGYRDFYTNAFPILEEHGFTATVFLPTGFIQHRLLFKGKECLSWKEIRELRRRGIGFGSHTVTHRELRFLNQPELAQELKQSREMIEDGMGAAIQAFSYPYAFPEHDRNFIQTLKMLLSANGYQAGVTTMIGRASQHDDPLLLRRLPVNDWDDLALYEAKLQGAYDWMRFPQGLKKRFERKHGLDKPDSSTFEEIDPTD